MVSDDEADTLNFQPLPDPSDATTGTELPRELFQAVEALRDDLETFQSLPPASPETSHATASFTPLAPPDIAESPSLTPLPATSAPAASEPSFAPGATPTAPGFAAMPTAAPASPGQASNAFAPLDSTGGEPSAATAATSGTDSETAVLLRELIQEIKGMRADMQKGGNVSGGTEQRRPGPQADGSFVPGGFGQMRGGTETKRPPGAYPRSRDQSGTSEWAHAVDRAIQFL